MVKVVIFKLTKHLEEFSEAAEVKYLKLDLKSLEEMLKTTEDIILCHLSITDNEMKPECRFFKNAQN